MFRLARLRMVLCALVVLLASLLVDGGVGAQPSAQDNALLRDAQWYAHDEGVSIDEALRRLALQESIGLLERTLTEREARTFAGLWIQHQPTYRVVVLLTSGDPQQVAPYIAGGPLANLVEVRPAGVALATLRAEKETLLQQLPHIPVAVDVDIDLANNKIVLRTSKPDQFRQQAQERGISLSNNVKLVAGNAGFTLADINGGRKFFNPNNSADYCTAGFALKKWTTNEVFTSTAGHCTNTLRAQETGTNLTYVGEYWTGNYDFQWHRAPNQVIKPQVWDGGANRPIRGMSAYPNQAVGAFVCKYGVTTGYGCGNIYTKEANGKFICVRNNNGVNLVDGGDSGGPWFNAYTAYGFTWAYPNATPNDGCYMSADKVQAQGFNIHVAP